MYETTHYILNNFSQFFIPILLLMWGDIYLKLKKNVIYKIIENILFRMTELNSGTPDVV